MASAVLARCGTLRSCTISVFLALFMDATTAEFLPVLDLCAYRADVELLMRGKSEGTSPRWSTCVAGSDDGCAEKGGGSYLGLTL